MEGKTVIITGAARGIGFAITEIFLEATCNVVLADIDSDMLEGARKKLIDTEPSWESRVKTVVCDVSKKEEVDRAVETSLEFTGFLDVCVANAGIVKSNDFLELSEEDFDAVIAVNLKGCFLTCQSAARKMVEQQKNHPSARDYSIITMSSVNSITAIPSLTAYNASKGAISNLTRNMALNLAAHGIRVNAVAPGSILTDMLKKVAHDRQVMHQVLSRTPMLRIGDPKEVARVVKFLASSDSSYMTGQVLFVDGGRLAMNYVNPVPDTVLDELCE